METLPEEMVEAVSVHLTLQDLLACCLVSRGWRETFNKDMVWRHHSSCHPDRAKYLLNSQSVVEPCFQRDRVNKTTLTPMCDKRVTMLQEKHLWRNWREGRFKKSVTINVAFIADRISFLTNDHLVLLLENKITLWNVHDHSNNGFFEPVDLPSDLCIKLCKMVGNDRVVVIQECMVYIFLWDLISPQWCFQYALSVNESDFKLFTRLDAIGFVQQQSRMSCFNVLGSVLFWWLEGQRVIHIWDIEKCMMLKEQELHTVNRFYVRDFLQSETRNKDILVATIQIKEDQCPMIVCYIYDLMDLTFKPFKGIVNYDIPSDSIVSKMYLQSFCYASYIIHGNSVSVTCENTLRVFNIDSLIADSKCKEPEPNSVSKICFPVYGIPQIFNDNFVFYSSHEVQAYNPLRKKNTTVLDCLMSPKSLLNVGNKFCIAYHKRSNSLFCDVWEIGKNLDTFETKTKLYNWNPGVLLVNEAGTVLVSVGKKEGRLCKLCFW